MVVSFGGLKPPDAASDALRQEPPGAAGSLPQASTSILQFTFARNAAGRGRLSLNQTRKAPGCGID